MLSAPWSRSVSFRCPTSAAVWPCWGDSRATGPRSAWVLPCVKRVNTAWWCVWTPTGVSNSKCPFGFCCVKTPPIFPCRQRGRFRMLSLSGVLQTLQAGLGRTPSLPPLLIVDGAQETADWERTLTFFLRTGMVVVEFLSHPSRLVFGRYETTLLLRSTGEEAEALSQTVGRKVTAESLAALEPGEGYFIHLSQVYRVRFPEQS